VHQFRHSLQLRLSVGPYQARRQGVETGAPCTNPHDLTRVCVSLLLRLRDLACGGTPSPAVLLHGCTPSELLAGQPTAVGRDLVSKSRSVTKSQSHKAFICLQTTFRLSSVYFFHRAVVCKTCTTLLLVLSKARCRVRPCNTDVDTSTLEEE
jgi:hypothetical protein